MDGVVVLDKPSGVTSRAAVDHVQRWFPRVKMGHAGTLDPLATGVLVICLGQAARFIEYAQRLPKTYEASIQLGATSNTDDAEGTIVPTPDAIPPTPEEIHRELQRFVGVTQQVPPIHSAIKVQGRRAHELARKGREVTLSPRPVEVYDVEVLGYVFPKLNVRIRCGKGTYVRSIARDLGQALRCGGYVGGLRRTRIGDFSLDAAVSWSTSPAEARALVLPLRTVLQGLPKLWVDPAEARSLRHGRLVVLAGEDGPDADAEVAILERPDVLVCVARWDAERRTLAPMKVLAAPSVAPANPFEPSG